MLSSTNQIPEMRKAKYSDYSIKCEMEHPLKIVHRKWNI